MRPALRRWQWPGGARPLRLHSSSSRRWRRRDCNRHRLLRHRAAQPRVPSVGKPQRRQRDLRHRRQFGRPRRASLRHCDGRRPQPQYGPHRSGEWWRRCTDWKWMATTRTTNSWRRLLADEPAARPWPTCPDRAKQGAAVEDRSGLHIDLLASHNISLFFHHISFVSARWDYDLQVGLDT